MADYYRAFPELQPWQPGGSGHGRSLERLAEIASRMKGGQSENQSIDAGYTYFAQFVAHDITDMSGPRLGRPTDLSRLVNRRSPLLDLDSLYGRSREEWPFLYETRPRGRFLLGRNAAGEPDLLRSRDESGYRGPANSDRHQFSPALIPDQRNDQTILISQLHLAFQRFHNRLAESSDFETARRLTRWHFQWLIANDLIPKLCGSYAVPLTRANEHRPHPRLFWRELPIEFVFAAFRTGHSMPRSDYTLNEGLAKKNLLSFDRFANYLNGGRVLPKGWSVQWDRFVEYEGSTPQKSMAIGPHLATELYDLPQSVVASARSYERWLPYRTLASGYWAGLPSGQAVAKALGIEGAFGEDREPDPLWYYVLLEAENDGGKQLGRVAAAIVSDVLHSRLLLDPDSYINVQPDWAPTPPDDWPDHRDYDLAAFLAQSGAPMNYAAVEAMQPV